MFGEFLGIRFGRGRKLDVILVASQAGFSACNSTNVCLAFGIEDGSKPLSGPRSLHQHRSAT